jgi:hypothetical protein
VFDEIFRAAKLHLAENFYAMRAVPFESMMMSILIEQQKAMRRLENEISANGGCAFRQKDGGQAGANRSCTSPEKNQIPSSISQFPRKSQDSNFKFQEFHIA